MKMIQKETGCMWRWGGEESRSERISKIAEAGAMTPQTHLQSARANILYEHQLFSQLLHFFYSSLLMICEMLQEGPGPWITAPV